MPDEPEKERDTVAPQPDQDKPKSFVRQVWEEWKVPLVVVLKPSVSAFFVVALFLLYGAARTKDQSTQLSLAALSSLVASIGGARFDRYWSALTDETTIKVRGRTAIRGLKDLFRNTVALRQRTNAHQTYLETSDAGADTVLEVTRQNWDEVLNQCGLLEAQVLSAIENWTDVAPEFKSFIDGYQSSEVDAQNTRSEIATTLSELKRTKSQNEIESAETANKILELESKIGQLQRNLLAQERRAIEGSYHLGASPVGTGSPVTEWFGNTSASPTLTEMPKNTIIPIIGLGDPQKPAKK